MMIFKKTIPRRAFIRGIGATLALPLLDAMVPAFGAPAKVKRLSMVYLPNGRIMQRRLVYADAIALKPIS